MSVPSLGGGAGGPVERRGGDAGRRAPVRPRLVGGQDAHAVVGPAIAPAVPDADAVAAHGVVHAPGPVELGAVEQLAALGPHRAELAGPVDEVHATHAMAPPVVVANDGDVAQQAGGHLGLAEGPVVLGGLEVDPARGHPVQLGVLPGLRVVVGPGHRLRRPDLVGRHAPLGDEVEALRAPAALVLELLDDAGDAVRAEADVRLALDGPEQRGGAGAGVGPAVALAVLVQARDDLAVVAAQPDVRELRLGSDLVADALAVLRLGDQRDVHGVERLHRGVTADRGLVVGAGDPAPGPALA